MAQHVPCLWFDLGQAEKAAEMYVDVFPNSRIVETTHYGPDMPAPEGGVMTVVVELDGHRYTLLNGGDQFPPTEATSFEIRCADQAEVDHYWDRLTADGGQESQCGWLKDPFGVSWQITPVRLNELISDPDPARAQAATQAMLRMRRLVVADLEAAADAAGPPRDR